MQFLSIWLLGLAVTFLAGLALVSTQSWHGHLSHDSTFGVQKFHTEATPRIGGVAVVVGAVVAWAFAAPSVQAILGPLLLAGVPGGEPQTVLVAPGTYGPGRVLDIHDGKPRQVRLTALLESGSNFERVTYTAA